ncbi:MAG: alanine racemase [Patescibacteria group bacterium]
MPNARYKTWVEINANSLKSNINSLRSLLQPGVTFCAVVKANAYGHEIDSIVRLCLIEGIGHFAVDSIDEAIEVRKRAPEATVFILGYTVRERIPEIIRNNFVQTVYNEEDITEIGQCAAAEQKKAFINLKIETGTQRQGIPLKKIDPFLREIRRYERFLELTGISSHFADAEHVNAPEFTHEQTRVFQEAVEIAQRLGFDPIFKHIACSAAAIAHEETQGTMVRFGITLYGLWSSEELRRVNNVSQRAIDLKPVLAWRTKVAQVKDVASGTSIGYGRTYVSDRPIRIAVLPVGYYDGYKRASSRQGQVLIKGQRCSILGTICMNMMMVDVSTLPNVKTGDTVTLLGRDGMHEITAEELAENMSTINYEVVSQINPLLPRLVI